MATADQGTVLIVEDDPQIAEMISAVLGDEGYQVARADDAVQAVALLEGYRHPPGQLCLVLLDMMLPRLEGLSVLGHLARLNCSVPVVAMSASPERLVAAVQAGVEGTLHKPFEIDRLLTVVEQVCRQGGSA